MSNGYSKVNHLSRGLHGKTAGFYKKLLHFRLRYIIIGIKPGRKLPPKRD
jgi:hypothetical protein